MENKWSFLQITKPDIVMYHFLVDIIIIDLFRELIENVVAVKPKRLSPKEQEELTVLLISKDKELKENLKVSEPLRW
jgi:hypothetical protein